MAALFWIITCLLTCLCAVLPEMVDLPPPMDLRLTSDHFIHILGWQRGAGTPPGVTYSVSVISETETLWRLVPGCEAVVDPLICNLTEAFPNPSLFYFMKVRAELQMHSAETRYSGFKPIRDTILDPPLLSVAPCGRHLCAQLHSPLERLRHIYEQLTYRLNVSRDNTFQFFKGPVSLSDVVFDDMVLAPGRRYCVSVCVLDSMELRESNYSRPVCVDTPSTFNTDVLVSVLLCLLMLGAVFIVALLVVAGFICLKRRPFPSALTSLHHIEEVLIIAAPCASSFSPLYEVKTTAPPTGDKRSRSSSLSSSSSLSEGEVEGATPGGGRVYLSKGGDNLSSSSVSTPSSPPCSSHLSPNPVTLLPHPSQALYSGKTGPPTGGQTMNTAEWTPKQSLEEEGGGLDVDLHTLTFGRQEEGGEEEEEEEEECSPIIAPPSQRETDEEEEEEELCEYIRH
ncbi:interleukin-10 receptor subunit beta-like [Cheilinus undulatus]|uniref:interleukin-10 receptor subunit beta-like n=1 Tax=Cheilinus undulatus TaxID=241271 RepID=UPI001BD5242E|nr:interleukin-10 receptor subunit beta-like [Cheilinus undulatus]